MSRRISASIPGRTTLTTTCSPVFRVALWTCATDAEAIGVASNMQGQGIGAKLVRAVESHLARVGAQTLVVDTSGADSFEPVRRFYLGQGYEKTGEIPNFWGAGDSKVTYYKAFVDP